MLANEKECQPITQTHYLTMKIQNNSFKRFRLSQTIAIALILSFSASGCHFFRKYEELVLPNDTKIFNHYTNYEKQLPKRVALVPFQQSARVDGSLKAEMESRLAAELRAAGCFEVIQTGVIPDFRGRFIESGQYSIHDLIKIQTRFEVDGLLFVSINELKAYPPISLGFTAHLVELSNGEVVKSVDGTWSALDPDFKEQLQQFSEAEDIDMALIQNSPRLTYQVVAKQIAQQIAE